MSKRDTGIVGVAPLFIESRLNVPRKSVMGGDAVITWSVDATDGDGVGSLAGSSSYTGKFKPDAGTLPLCAGGTIGTCELGCTPSRGG